MGTITAGVVRERTPGERRVALVPDSIPRLQSAGFDVLVETGAGAGAWFSDDAYTAAGATVVKAAELYERADVVLCVGASAGETAVLRAGQTLVGTLEPFQHPELVRHWADLGVTAVSLDMLPRKISAAQSMDVLTSQANISGYKALLLAANAYGRYFPMLMTAAGTSKPASVLILGAGVAGLQAIGMARRLGAVVSAYDVRPESKGEVSSLGAKFLELTAVQSGSGEGGYARELTAEEQRAQQEELDNYIGNADVVITTARVPGKRPPLLVTERALNRMRAGSVVVDMGASDLGGNVEGSQPDETRVLDNGVTLIGAGNLASSMAAAASAAYSRNVAALLKHMTTDGKLDIDTSDGVQAGVVLTHAGSVVNSDIAEFLEGWTVAGGAK